MRDKEHANGPLSTERGPLLVILLFAVALASGYLALAPMVERADSASSRHELDPYDIQGDRFSNYDFLSESYDRNNVDWATNLIFAHGGTISRVKHQLDPVFDISRDEFETPVGSLELGASPMHARINDGPQGSGGEWDQDSGKKTRRCQSEDDPNVFHFRLYAPPEVDNFFNQKWGNYVIGTSHVDHNECPVSTAGSNGSPAWAGRSERAEEYIAYEVGQLFSHPRIYQDRVWLKNWERSKMRITHWWLNDGKATFINVSGKLPED